MRSGSSEASYSERAPNAMPNDLDGRKRRDAQKRSTMWSSSGKCRNAKPAIGSNRLKLTNGLSESSQSDNEHECTCSSLGEPSSSCGLRGSERFSVYI